MAKNAGRHSARNMKRFIDRLMRRMTLDEKIGQLNLVASAASTVTGSGVNEGIEEKIRQGKVGGMLNVWSAETLRKIQELTVNESRLKIPMLFGADVIHGHKTIFPIPLALSCSWDMELIEKTARIAATEAAADGLKWTFSPMVDVTRDPRWGRCAEGSGEDTHLGNRIAEAMVKGYQGDDLTRTDTVMSCVKHFALYGAADGGRDYNTVDMSEQKMRETYLPPFEAALKAGAGSLMTAFNDVNGIPASMHKELLTDILRKEWGFKGFVVTDYTSINEMVAHGMGDLKKVSMLALKAGVDMDMVGEGFLKTLKQSFDERRVSAKEINAACRRILEAKYKLGLFDDPYQFFNPQRAADKILCDEHRQTAREAAAKSCVLLKNNDDVLPLKKSGTIALIGPLADDKKNLPGTWAVAADAEKCIPVIDGVKKAVGADATILYAKGANITDDPVLMKNVNCFNETATIDARTPEDMIAEAVAIAQKSDVIVAVVGEAKEMTGECSSRTDITLSEGQQKLIKALSETGKPLVLVVMGGRPLALTQESKQAQAILMSWFGGTEAGHGLADVLFGDHNPSGKLTMSFPVNVGQIPVYHAYKNTGRPAPGKDFHKFTSVYLDAPNAPLYPFGHGLSYTRFLYSPVTLDKKTVKGNGTLKASVTLTNTGTRAGEETVQLYIGDPEASSTRPVKELKGFKKVCLKPGETKEVTFDITPEDLKFYDAKLKHDWEAGDFLIHIGTSSADTQVARVCWEKRAVKPKKTASRRSKL